MQLLYQVQKNPVGKHVEHIVHAQVGDGEQQYVAIEQRAPQLREIDMVRHRFAGHFGDHCKFQLRDRGVISSSAGKLVHHSACCQPSTTMIDAISGGVAAAPSPSPMVCSPCTSAQRRGGNQASNTPAETGKIAA